MSSFLMNPSAAGGYHQQHQPPSHHLSAASVVVDPEFPPSEEYSQRNYIPSTGVDFFSGSHHLNHSQSHQLQYGYHQHHHQAVSTPYGTTSAVPLNGGYAGYGGYYSPHHPNHQVHAVHHTGLHPHHHAVGALAMPPEAQQPPLTCPPSMQNQQQQSQQQQPQPTPTILGSTLSPTLLTSHIQPSDSLQHQSHSQQGQPQQSQAQQQQQQQVDNSVCSPTGNSLHRDNSPDLQQSQSAQPTGHLQSSQQTQQMTPQHHPDDGSDGDDLDDDQMLDGSPGMLDDDEEDDENGERVVYPWMKKIHVAGVGEFYFVIFFPVAILIFLLFSSEGGHPTAHFVSVLSTNL